MSNRSIPTSFKLLIVVNGTYARLLDVDNLDLAVQGNWVTLQSGAAVRARKDQLSHLGVTAYLRAVRLHECRTIDVLRRVVLDELGNDRAAYSSDNGGASRD